MKKVIHVNRHNIAANKKAGNANKPVFTVKTYMDNRRGNGVRLLDKDGREIARFVYRPEKPLACGAVAWLETSAEVVVL